MGNVRSSDQQLIVSPLTNGLNPRATGSLFYGGTVTGLHTHVIQTYDLRRSAGAPLFNYARLLRYGRTPLLTSLTGINDFIVYGFPTSAANMPSSGAATWTGAGTGSYAAASATSSFDFLGDATLNIDFGNRTISGAINNIIYADAISVITPTGDRFNNIALNGTISGAGFSGAAQVDFLTSPDISAAMSGQFYGPNNGPPVEAGGAFSGAGTAGHVFGGFVVGSP